MNRQDARRLLQKYRLGQCTPEEKSWVEQWYLEIARQEVTMKDDIVKQRLSTWKAVQNNISNGRRHDYLFRRPLQVAASVAVLLGLSFLTYQNKAVFFKSKSEQLAYTVIETKKSQLGNFVLPDGSTVWLNAGSKLKYSSLFNRKLREVTLEDGEAYFDIRHDTEKPFVVYAGKTKTQVLGTAFAVKSYKNLSQTQISVASGKVGVMGSGATGKHPVFLLPNQQVTFNAAGSTFEKANINAQDFIGWKDGKLQFNNENLASIAVMLEKKFDTSIQFKERDLSKLRFSAGFEASEKLDDILEVLCLAENLTYKIDGKKITLSRSN
ncbi:FecR family protein [Dyadobacter diqingensis]|uniref:FecR family protein n=1 Tax=Dyadobacter diqingensis TaxID=2938121 RepID=UPI0020C1B160|nr:FecR domain-containing protein [Dyadobacter diqingensis]